MYEKEERLMLSLTVCYFGVPNCNLWFCFWSYSHALQVKPVYMTAGPVIFVLPLFSLRTTRKIAIFWYHHGRPGTYCLKQKGVCFDVWCWHKQEKKRKKKRFRNIVSMLVYKTYNRFNLVCSCEKDYIKNWYLTEKKKTCKKKKKNW